MRCPFSNAAESSVSLDGMVSAVATNFLLNIIVEYPEPDVPVLFIRNQEAFGGHGSKRGRKSNDRQMAERDHH